MARAIGTSFGEDLPNTSLRKWQWRIFITAWITYGSLYLGRVNIAVALPVLQDSFGWTKSETGLIGSAFFWIYAIGQLVNGLLGDRWSPRKFVAFGVLASAITNLAFGFSNYLILMILIWGINGYAQSTGWGPIMRVLSHWFSPEQRGRITAFFSPCYVLGHVVSWLIASWLVAKTGWRAAFWFPAGWLALVAGLWWAQIRDSRASAGLPIINSGNLPKNQGERAPRSTFKTMLSHVLSHPHLQLAAFSCLALGIVKESFSLWIPTYLMETQGFDIAKAAGFAIWLPLAGALGIFAAGWASHRFFRSEEAPIVAALAAGLSLAIAAYRPLVSHVGTAAIPPSLGLIGAMIYGANGLLLTALPLTQSGQGRVSSAAGFLDFASYIGSGLGGIGTGLLVDRWGWGAAFGFWTAAAGVSIILALGMWQQRRSSIPINMEG